MVFILCIVVGLVLCTVHCKRASNTENEHKLERQLSNEQIALTNLRGNVKYALDMLKIIDKQAKNDVAICNITTIAIGRLEENDKDEPDGGELND